MTSDNIVRGVRALERRRPFRPYLIELVSGDRFLVSHPELIVPDGEMFAYCSPSGRWRLFEADSVCQLLDVPEEGPQ
jgi:hypothetical protein